MRISGSKLGLLFLPSVATLGLLALVWAITTGSSQAQQGAIQNCPSPASGPYRSGTATTPPPASHCREMPGLPGSRGLATLADAIT
jgi:hypothetical protein